MNTSRSTLRVFALVACILMPSVNMRAQSTIPASPAALPEPNRGRIILNDDGDYIYIGNNAEEMARKPQPKVPEQREGYPRFAYNRNTTLKGLHIDFYECALCNPFRVVFVDNPLPKVSQTRPWDDESHAFGVQPIALAAKRKLGGIPSYHDI